MSSYSRKNYDFYSVFILKLPLRLGYNRKKEIKEKSKNMSFREWLKQFLPMSSQSLNKRLTAMEKQLQTLNTNYNELKTLSYNHLDPDLYAHAIKQWYQDITGNPLDLENPKPITKRSSG